MQNTAFADLNIVAMECVTDCQLHIEEMAGTPTITNVPILAVEYFNEKPE